LYVTTQTCGNIKFTLYLSQENPVNFFDEGIVYEQESSQRIFKIAAGKVQEEVGKLVGSKEQQVKGLGKQITGNAEKSYGDAKEIIKDANK